MPILKLEPNKPYELALKYKSGKPAKSLSGDPQLMLTTTKGLILYLPVHVAESITELHLGPQEPFILTKQSTANQITWSVERVAPNGTRASLVPASGSSVPTPAIPVNGHGESAVDVAMKAAIDVCVRGQKYAAAKGLSLQFVGEDVRTIMNTIQIGMQERR